MRSAAEPLADANPACFFTFDFLLIIQSWFCAPRPARRDSIARRWATCAPPVLQPLSLTSIRSRTAGTCRARPMRPRLLLLRRDSFGCGRGHSGVGLLRPQPCTASRTDGIEVWIGSSGCPTIRRSQQRVFLLVAALGFNLMVHLLYEPSPHSLWLSFFRSASFSFRCPFYRRRLTAFGNGLFLLRMRQAAASIQLILRSPLRDNTLQVRTTMPNTELEATAIAPELGRWFR